ncbi:MAG: hypothetical protein LBI84_02070 [Propionibacteriaceae bacterium]|jgi:hypothetical protein|nr:hypothetical protein [Propionibacteriaceae bacterium]
MPHRPPGLLLGLAAVPLLGLAALLASLAGLLSDPRISGTPQPAYTPEPAVIPAGADEAATLTAAAWAVVAGGADWNSEPERWTTLADTLVVHWRVLTGPDPLNRVEGDGLPGEPEDTPSAEDALRQADAALAALSDTEWARAAAANGIEAAWWAGLAGAADQARQGLTGPYAAPKPLNPLATLALLPENEAFANLAAADHAAVFTAATVLGWLPPGHWLKGTAQELLERFRRDRDNLHDVAEACGWDFPAAAPAYDVPPLSDDASAQAALGQAAAGVAAGAVGWLAAASDEQRGQAVAEARQTAAAGQGYASALWFGWPD